MEWLKNHWAEIGVIALSAHTFAKAIVDVTTTKKDDAILEKIGAVIAYLFGKRPN